MVRSPCLVRRTLGLALLLATAGSASPSPAECQVPATTAQPDGMREDSLLWHRYGRLTPAAGAAIGLLAAAAERGLDPAAYEADRLDSMARQSAAASSEHQYRLDRGLTTGFLRFLQDARGQRTPGTREPDLAGALLEAIAGDTLPQFVAALEPDLAQYRAVRQALAQYRRLAEDATLGPIPRSRTVHPGEPYEGIEPLVRLLQATGDLSRDAPPPPAAYDGPLPAAVIRFQQRHGLAADGILGPETFKALDTPLRWRVRQLELALERLRRLPPPLDERLIVVNVPAFRLYALDSAATGGTPALAGRVVVGRALDTRTPGLFEEMRTVEFWPYWNVPRSILVNEILPILRVRPEYLLAEDMELVDAKGRVVNGEVHPGVLERLRLGALRVRQRPGPGNALGLVKFVFPNAAQVYIHGTPRPEAFQHPRRDLSHGCIRMEDVAGLATWVLRGQNGWTADSTAAALASGRRRRVTLERPLSVAIFYTTAAAGANGRVFFYEDIYGLDPPLDRELRSRAAAHSALRSVGAAE